VKAVVLDPDNDFNVDRSLTKEDVRKLVEVCVEKLMDKVSPSLDTVKMQVYFDMNYTSRGTNMCLMRCMSQSTPYLSRILY
jgi:ribosomal protein L19E